MGGTLTLVQEGFLLSRSCFEMIRLVLFGRHCGEIAKHYQTDVATTEGGGVGRGVYMSLGQDKDREDDAEECPEKKLNIKPFDVCIV